MDSSSKQGTIRRRRKRKQRDSMQRLKPELMFVESPIEGSKHYSTPVQAARNPYMAPSIPVEDLSAKWISPQFPENATPEMKNGKRRRINRYKKDRENTNDAQTTLSIPPLGFKDKLQSNIREGKTTRVRHSTRLEEKQRHFLFKDMNALSPELQNMKVLVNNTPDNSVFPVVLRRLRDRSKAKHKPSTSKRKK